MKKEWKLNNGNEVLIGDGFYISYNPDCSSSATMKQINSLGHEMGKLIGEIIEKRPGSETALVHINDINSNFDRTYFILNGDFRDQYFDLFDKGFEACHKFFESKPEFHSGWSTKI